MVEPRLSVRSAKAGDLARRIAHRENCSIVEIVERVLESYEIRETGREPAASFYARLAAQSGTDIDLEAVIKDGRQAHKGVEPNPLHLLSSPRALHCSNESR